MKENFKLILKEKIKQNCVAANVIDSADREKYFLKPPKFVDYLHNKTNTIKNNCLFAIFQHTEPTEKKKKTT